MSGKKKTFRVYVAQVNQTYVEVEAVDEHEAREKGYAKWRRESAHSRVLSVELDGPDEAESKGGVRRVSP